MTKMNVTNMAYAHQCWQPIANNILKQTLKCIKIAACIQRLSEITWVSRSHFYRAMRYWDCMSNWCVSRHCVICVTGHQPLRWCAPL